MWFFFTSLKAFTWNKKHRLKHLRDLTCCWVIKYNDCKIVHENTHRFLLDSLVKTENDLVMWPKCIIYWLSLYKMWKMRHVNKTVPIKNIP